MPRGNPLGAPGKLTVIPAIRYDSFNSSSTGNPDQHSDQVSPKFAATYAPMDWLFAFGNVGEAFRAPGINELYLTGIHFAVPNPFDPNYNNKGIPFRMHISVTCGPSRPIWAKCCGISNRVETVRKSFAGLPKCRFAIPARIAQATGIGTSRTEAPLPQTNLSA